MSIRPIRRPSQDPAGSVKPGEVVALKDEDYKYGIGPLNLRILRVRDDLSAYYDGEWIWLEGVELNPDGSAGPFRQALVRASVLTTPGGDA